jgi:hypothetical protein
MKQPEDLRTIELPLVDTLMPRRRGRPPKADKMTDAERARRYRARRKMQPKDSWNYPYVTQLAREEIGRMLADVASRPSSEAELMRQWAYGMFLLWDRTTGQCQRSDDRQALLALVS